MADKTYKNIEDIKEGDEVLSYNINTKEPELAKVNKLFIHEDCNNGLILNNIIKTTTNHPFYVNNDWVEAGNLKIGDEILHVSGIKHKITNIELNTNKQTVYNFEAPGNHNYFAEGYLVHNKHVGDQASDNLYPFILMRNWANRTEAEKEVENVSIANGYIRWDALCQLFNKHFIPRNSKDDKPIFTMTCCQVINEDLPVNTSNPRGGKHISPILMAKVDDPLADKVMSPPNSLDNSLDPTVCLLPLQNKDSLSNARSDQLVYNFVLNGILPPFGDSKLEEEVIAMMEYTLTEEEKIHYIGHVYLNVSRLLQTYKSMKYTEDNVINKDFYMWDYIKKIWDDVNDACGDTHDFKLTTDLERPNLVRVIDMRYQDNANIKQDDIITLNIQSTDSIVRDYSYNTSVPSAMSSTIAIAAQAPKNIDSLEAASFGAFHKHIINRFASFANPKAIDDTEKTALAAIFDESHDTYRNGTRDLGKHQDDILAGNFLVVAEGGDVVRSEEVGKMKGLVSSVRRASEDLIQMYPVDSGGNFKGQPILKKAAKPTSAIVPLKFNATLDGIGGIIIGNVFKLPPERLPRGYKDANIAFVVMGEDQDITSGQDWTTKITGQMIMLPTGGTGEDTGWEEYDYNQYDETLKGEYNTDTEGENTQAITDQQALIDAGMNEVRVGDDVYLKMDTATHVRVSAVVDNESAGFGIDWDDNVIGMFSGEDVVWDGKRDESNKGLFLGKVIEMTSQPIYILGDDNNYYWANNDGTPNKSRGIVNKKDIGNDEWPWYKIWFSQDARDKFNSGWVTQGDKDGDIDPDSADYGKFPVTSNDRRKRQQAIDYGYIDSYDTLINGWMRLDVLAAKEKERKENETWTQIKDWIRNDK